MLMPQIKKKKNQNMGFLGGLAGKESTCNMGDLDWIPGLGRSPGDGKGYPLQYSWASLVPQLVKNLPAMSETWVQPLVGKIPRRSKWLPTPVFLSEKFHGQRSLMGYIQFMVSQKVGHS